MNDIADLAKKYHTWFHVDAAYGGFFILTSRKNLFKGIERADSMIVDPHKGMFLPYGVGAVLIKDISATLHSNYYEANYMQDAAEDELAKSPQIFHRSLPNISEGCVYGCHCSIMALNLSSHASKKNCSWLNISGNNCRKEDFGLDLNLIYQ